MDGRLTAKLKEDKTPAHGPDPAGEGFLLDPRRVYFSNKKFLSLMQDLTVLEEGKIKLFSSKLVALSRPLFC